MEAASTMWFDPRALTVEAVFTGPDSYYQIPDYQRPYSWKTEQVEQLWDDLYAAFQSNDESYFLGPLVLAKPRGPAATTDDRLEVVDGQQRLTTLTILLAVARDRHLEGDKQVQHAIRSLDKDKYRLRLITQSQYQIEFETSVLEHVDLSSGRGKRDANAFLQAAALFDERLKKVFQEGGVERVRAFILYVLGRVVMIAITCSSVGSAIKLFQILNTRGMELSNADLMRSFLIAKSISEEGARDAVATTLIKIEERLKSLQVWGVLRCIQRVSMNNPQRDYIRLGSGQHQEAPEYPNDRRQDLLARHGAWGKRDAWR